MKVLNQDDVETFEDYGTSGYPSVYQRIQYDKLQFAYAYASNGVEVDFRSAQMGRYGIYGKVCIVSDSDGNWMDTFGLPDAGFDFMYPSICEKINQHTPSLTGSNTN